MKEKSQYGERRSAHEEKPENKQTDPKDEKKIKDEKKEGHEERGERKRHEGDRKFDDKKKFEKKRYDDGPPIEEEPEPTGMTYEEFKAHAEAKRKNLQKATIREHDNTKEKKTGGLEEVKKQDEKQKQINSQIKDIDVYNLGVSKGENDGLLGF